MRINKLKLPFFLAFSLILAVLFSGCSVITNNPKAGQSTGDNNKNLSITFIDTAGGANMQKYFAELIPKAKKELGFNINYVVGSAPEIQQRLAAQKKGKGDIDVLLLKPDGIGNMLQSGIPFEKLNNNKNIPNVSLVSPADLKDALGVPTNGEAAPFWKDQFGIIYNSDKIKNPPKSWKEFNDRKNEWQGHIGMVRTDAKSGGGRIMLRDFLIGYGVDFSKPFNEIKQSTEWNNAVSNFEDFSKALYKPLASEPPVLFQQFASENVWISEYAVDYTLWSRDQGLLPKSIKSTFFPSGLYGGASYLAIPSNVSSAQKDLANKFVNWMLSDKTQLDLMKKMYVYMGINKYDNVPNTVWKNITPWQDVEKHRIPLSNNESYKYLTEHGMDLVK